MLNGQKMGRWKIRGTGGKVENKGNRGEDGK
jgi:hypothetical protein